MEKKSVDSAWSLFHVVMNHILGILQQWPGEIFHHFAVHEADTGALFVSLHELQLARKHCQENVVKIDSDGKQQIISVSNLLGPDDVAFLRSDSSDVAFLRSDSSDSVGAVDAEEPHVEGETGWGRQLSEELLEMRVEAPKLTRERRLSIRDTDVFDEDPVELEALFNEIGMPGEDAAVAAELFKDQGILNNINLLEIMEGSSKGLEDALGESHAAIKTGDKRRIIKYMKKVKNTAC